MLRHPLRDCEFGEPVPQILPSVSLRSRFKVRGDVVDWEAALSLDGAGETLFSVSRCLSSEKEGRSADGPTFREFVDRPLPSDLPVDICGSRFGGRAIDGLEARGLWDKFDLSDDLGPDRCHEGLFDIVGSDRFDDERWGPTV